ncbi:bifunctional (p)ppGpp synthetase/guanosine-3',5'-bis(diphosphate) 3'-pyrophosphohydrolase [Candidatus Parabeggiatoa sp. HSG14]|uniref:RelA/SpoT family protein n=1 Tax=Candidatus Parabeggiatoa sp. HSG14 TaxID=3055593 RepID=UPI0025A913E3|nr:bifunctional (p)ppGpp synthetase/guanosine-3',5'-bis(diphosphate) 3'-pyrophosphohydrolase [Thiotrichales bacterium HSG14]
MPISLDLPPRLLVSDLCHSLETYLETEQVKEVYRAYLFSAEAHEGQKRKSGEPYIFHPLAATYILSQMHLDTQTLCAALLHDVIEDTDITKEKLGSEFGEQVAELVDGVSKLSSIQFKTREQAQAESFRKMILAMNRDIRVIIVKLADRLHNMRTLNAMTPESQRRIARETMEIYAPIAHRLGMNTMRIALEEFSFEALYPWRYKVLAHWTQKVYSKRADIFDKIQNTIERCLTKRGIQAKIQRRKRHYYGIYYKMREKKESSSLDKRKTFFQITNVCALRLIVDTEDSCYRSLGVVHRLYKPMCEHFKDYIAIPKINGYQSLHTILFSPHGFLIEVQIRTTEMHELSETGITAYGLINSLDDKNNQDEPCYRPPCQRASEWLRELLDMQKSTGDSLEFLEHVKTDLFPEEVYVFTPKGKIMQLPKGATAVDFAYAIHSDIGNKCIASKIDNQYASLATPLVSGQTIEVLTAKWARPKPNWLNFAISARARSHIRNFLKKLQYEEAVRLGKEMLDKELTTYSLSANKLTEKQQAHLLATFKVNNLDMLLADIGLGNQIALIVARQFDPTSDSLIKSSIINGKPKPLIIKGTEGILINFSRCCRPIPGDEIIGFVSAGRGIIIHSTACKHVFGFQPDKLIVVEWESGIEGEFFVDICVDVQDKRGVLANVAAGITNMGSDIDYVSNENKEGRHSTLRFCISVRNRVHLAAIMRHLRRLENVTRIQRNRN